MYGSNRKRGKKRERMKESFTLEQLCDGEEGLAQLQQKVIEEKNRVDREFDRQTIIRPPKTLRCTDDAKISSDTASLINKEEMEKKEVVGEDYPFDGQEEDSKSFLFNNEEENCRRSPFILRKQDEIVEKQNVHDCENNSLEVWGGVSCSDGHLKLGFPPVLSNESENDVSQNYASSSSDTSVLTQSSPLLVHKKRKRKVDIPEVIIEYLRNWMMCPTHNSNPCPNNDELDILTTKTGLTKKKLKNWFIDNQVQHDKIMFKKSVQFASTHHHQDSQFIDCNEKDEDCTFLVNKKQKVILNTNEHGSIKTGLNGHLLRSNKQMQETRALRSCSQSTSSSNLHPTSFTDLIPRRIYKGCRSKDVSYYETWGSCHLPGFEWDSNVPIGYDVPLGRVYFSGFTFKKTNISVGDFYWRWFSEKKMWELYRVVGCFQSTKSFWGIQEGRQEIQKRGHPYAWMVHLNLSPNLARKKKPWEKSGKCSLPNYSKSTATDHVLNLPDWVGHMLSCHFHIDSSMRIARESNGTILSLNDWTCSWTTMHKGGELSHELSDRQFELLSSDAKNLLFGKFLPHTEWPKPFKAIQMVLTACKTNLDSVDCGKLKKEDADSSDDSDDSEGEKQIDSRQRCNSDSDGNNDIKTSREDESEEDVNVLLDIVPTTLGESENVFLHQNIVLVFDNNNHSINNEGLELPSLDKDITNSIEVSEFDMHSVTNNLHKLLEMGASELKCSNFDSYVYSLCSYTMLGYDVVYITSIGSGEDLCWKLPAVVEKGVTVIIELGDIERIAEMKQTSDQKMQYKLLDSEITAKKDLLGILNKAILNKNKNESIDVPLILATTIDIILCGDCIHILKGIKVDRFVVYDKCCQWQSYGRLSKIRDECPNIPFLFLSNSLDTDYLTMLAKEFGPSSPNSSCVAKIKIFTNPRPISNYISFSVELQESLEQVAFRMHEIISNSEEMNPKCLCYCKMTNTCIRMMLLLNKMGISSDALCTSSVVREKEVIDRLRSGKIQVLCLVNAIDLNALDIRFVFHLKTPSSLQEYVHETSFAGKRKKRSFCILFFHPYHTVDQDKNSQIDSNVLRYATCGNKEQCRYKQLVKSYPYLSNCKRENTGCDPKYALCDNCVAKRDRTFQHDMNISKLIKRVLKDMQNIKEGDCCNYLTFSKLIKDHKDCHRGLDSLSVSLKKCILFLFADLQLFNVERRGKKKYIQSQWDMFITKDNKAKINSLIINIREGKAEFYIRNTTWDFKTFMEFQIFHELNEMIEATQIKSRMKHQPDDETFPESVSLATFSRFKCELSKFNEILHPNLSIPHFIKFWLPYMDYHNQFELIR
mmetsp:Transcript_17196/g.38724  ORF Transcript_17196/g.38724 Transcript_17196/m.38724 type:complete len:1325 (+) Transcript_17196:259-4233(+)